MSPQDNPLRVLLVEDNPGDARLVEIMLTETDDGAFLVSKAGRLDEALAVIGQGGIDVVLLDLGLPDSVGLDTAARAAEAAPETPIVVLTGLNDETTGMEAVRRGVQDYLAKDQIEGPIVRKTLLYAIDQHAASAVLRRQFSSQQQMVDAMPTPAFYTDKAHAILGCNRAFEETVGIARSDLLGGLIYEVLPQELSDCVKKSNPGQAGTPQTRSVTYTRPDGARHEARLTVTALADPGGEIGGLVVCLSDA